MIVLGKRPLFAPISSFSIQYIYVYYGKGVRHRKVMRSNFVAMVNFLLPLHRAIFLFLLLLSFLPPLLLLLIPLLLPASYAIPYTRATIVLSR